jgi:hypothetical protein
MQKVPPLWWRISYVLLLATTACKSDAERLKDLKSRELESSLLLSAQQRRCDAIAGAEGLTGSSTRTASPKAVACFDTLTRLDTRHELAQRDLNKFMGR